MEKIMPPQYRDKVRSGKRRPATFLALIILLVIYTYVCCCMGLPGRDEYVIKDYL